MSRRPCAAQVAHHGGAVGLPAAAARGAAAPRAAAALHQRHLAPGATCGGAAGHGAVIGLQVFLWSLGRWNQWKLEVGDRIA